MRIASGMKKSKSRRLKRVDSAMPTCTCVSIASQLRAEGTEAAQRIRYMPGGATLVATMRKHGAYCALVSGGFTFFTRYVAAELGMDFVRSNELEIADGALTGRVVMQDWGDICDGEQKRLMLLQCCEAIGCRPDQAIAVGDGANDLPMMQACADAGGLSVAYHAKPKVREQAMVSIEMGGLDRLLEVLAPGL